VGNRFVHVFNFTLTTTWGRVVLWLIVRANACVCLHIVRAIDTWGSLCVC